MSTREPLSGTSPDVHPIPPGASRTMRAAAARMISPIERFLAIEASSGLLLIIAAVVALAWANSPWASGYQALWHTPIGLRLGGFAFERDLHFWINDGLMTIFFFVVGLEIRREIHRGELSDLRRAALPLAAALGGMLVPAALYLALNHGRASSVGWGVPMATDIAFAVGVLVLLGKRVAPAMRTLLLALAVIDDVGAIVVIAAFYSSGLQIMGAVLVGVGVGGIVLLQKLGARGSWAYVVPSVVIWAGAYASGVHPTLAGVVVGLLTPVKAWYGQRHFLQHAAATVDAVRGQLIDGDGEHDVDDKQLLPHLSDLNIAGREAIAPVERLQHALHPWVAYAIMPLFAIANAGVALGGATFEGDGLRVFIGVTLGLIVGKPLGIAGLSLLAARGGLVRLPGGVSRSGVVVVGMVGGIGFTMALFIAALAFPAGPLLQTAKLGILAASVGAAVLGVTLGRLVLRPSHQAGTT